MSDGVKFEEIPSAVVQNQLNWNVKGSPPDPSPNSPGVRNSLIIVQLQGNHLSINLVIL